MPAVSRGDALEVDVGGQGHAAGVHPQDGRPALLVGRADDDAPVEAAGRSSAGSRTSGRLVAAITMTPSSPVKPSISVRIWFKVCSRSSLPPIWPPAERARPMASSSSMKMIAGAESLACLKRSRTRLAPTPTNISTNSEADSQKKGTSASPATARASSVLPVPGWPESSTPRGMRAPSLR